MRSFVLQKGILIILCFWPSVFLFAQNGTIRGRVHNGQEDLPNATVSVGKLTTLTNNIGEFSLSVKAGNYLLSITHAGYQKIEQPVKIDTGSTQFVDFILIPNEQLGEVVLLGSRSAVQRSNLATPVPVDVLSSQQLLQTGQVSLMQMLSFSVPSIAASRPIINEPVTLRGLYPDQLLILVNGTRRHNMANLTPGGIRGVLGNGTVPNDLNSIPPSAIEKIEILRDGAAAQYGSDAIAGVINIILKKTTGKTNIQLNTGQYYLGDGANISLGINRGIDLNKKGFLNFSANFRHAASTYRGGEFGGIVYKTIPKNATRNDSMRIKAQDDSMVAARGFNRRVSNAGSSENTISGMAINGGYSFSKKMELFWTAIANHRKTVFYNGYTFPKDTMRVNPLLFPDGYGAKPYHYATDLSGIVGFKGLLNKQIAWEYTAAYGNNYDKWFNKDANNASQFYTLGKNAPRVFYTGTYIYGQLTNTIQVSKKLFHNAKQFANISMGAEWRRENFQMKAGEEATYLNYDSILRRKLGGTTGSVVPPENTVNKNRNVMAPYTDFEIELSKRMLVDMAVRYEYYNDFGSNLAGKIATRYKVSDNFSIRGAFNNGFRAPSLQQRFYSGTIRAGTTPDGQPIIAGIFRNDSYVAKAFGTPSLGAEQSLNASGGITATLFHHIRMTVDAYWIQIKDRIVLGGRFDKTNPKVKEILTPYPEVTAAQFFSNAINTTTRGLDAVLNGNWKMGKGNLFALLAGNFTKTRLFGKIKTAANLPADSLNTNTLFGRYERGRLERGQPDSKIILSLNYKRNKLGFLLRNTRFGHTAILSNNLTISADENFSPKILTDVSFNFEPKNWLNLTAGVNNVFNIYPDRLKDYRNTQEGALIYGHEASPFGYYGGYYFVNMNFLF